MADVESNLFDLRPYSIALRRRWFPATLTFGVVLALTTLYTLSRTPIYRASGQLIFRSERPSGLDLLGASGFDPLSNARGQGLQTELRILRSRPLLEEVVNSLKGEQPHEALPAEVPLNAGTLAAGLQVAAVRDTQILEVSFDGPDPQLAQRIVNHLMQTYVASNLQANRANMTSAREFLMEQLPEVRQRVFENELALRRFKEAHNFTDVGAATALNNSRTSSLVAELDGVAAQLAELNTRAADIERQLGVAGMGQALTVSALSQSPGVQDVLSTLETVQKNLAEQRAELSEDHPTVVALRARQAELQRELRARVGATVVNGTDGPLRVGATEQGLLDMLVQTDLQRRSLLEKQAALQQQQQSYQRQATLIPQLQQQQRELERELQASESTYESLLRSLQEIRVTENQTIPSVRVMQTATTPSRPIAPNQRSALTAGVLLGLLLTAGVVILLEAMDRKLKTVDALQEVYPFTLLGSIPRFTVAKGEEEYLLAGVVQPRSALSESYRMLQANLKFLRSDGTVRIIVTTSALPQEGKSITTANLAVALAQMGHRVLLLDADLRRPTQHRIWEVTNALGLSNWLASPQQSLPVPCRQVYEQIDLVTSGVVPPNPLALLDSQRTVELIQDQAEHYDYVLIDAPPVSVAADALVLGKMADGVLMVARPGEITREDAALATKSLQQSGVTVLGMVVNGVIPENEGYSYYYYSRRYYGRTGESAAAETMPLPQKSVPPV